MSDANGCALTSGAQNANKKMINPTSGAVGFDIGHCPASWVFIIDQRIASVNRWPVIE